jgi:hypothetical protein
MNANTIVAAIAVMIEIQGALLLASAEPIGSITISAIMGICGNRVIAGWLMVLSFPFAVIGLSWQQLPRWGSGICLLPQLGISLVYGYGAVIAIIQARYADGVQRPPSFILVDQLALLVLMALHSASVAEVLGKR